VPFSRQSIRRPRIVAANSIITAHAAGSMPQPPHSKKN
jgi:hypothetical protein